MKDTNPILVVEDSPDDLFAIRRALRKAHIDNPLLIAKNGQEAVDYLGGVGQFADRDAHPLPFIVFLDLKLPLLDGFDVLGWVREHPELSQIVFIVLTSSDEERDHRRAYSLGARSYLVKPPTPEAVAVLFASLESLWGGMRRHPVEHGAAE